VDRAEAFMPRSEQIPGEQFNAGDRVRCLILDVRDVGNQVKIVLSRSHPDFIKRLFEVEVPEVAERIIEIKAMAREAGYRTKIAVSSIDSKVDAVGACVGVRGSRIKNIVDELNGEKIDIVRWNESSQILIQNALKPAEVSEISLCFELGRGTVVVRDDQLSLAIGKRGQNVRLAARLTGWDIDILTPEEFQKGLDILSETLQQVEGVTEEMVDKLAALGMISVFDIEEVGAEVLVNELAVSEDAAAQMIQVAAERSKVVAEQQAKDKQEAERKRQQEEAAAARLLGGLTGDAGVVEGQPGVGVTAEDDARAADILGGGTSVAAAPEQPAGA
jgi:transcription termination/antitermination protein NusA